MLLIINKLETMATPIADSWGVGPQQARLVRFASSPMLRMGFKAIISNKLSECGFVR
jgi:hypothetical protein